MQTINLKLFQLRCCTRKKGAIFPVEMLNIDEIVQNKDHTPH